MPTAALRRHVQSFWQVQGPCSEVMPQLIAPDGCISLVLNFGEPLEQLIGPSQAVRRPKTLVIGEVRKPISVQSNGNVDLLGVRFWPGAAQGFIDAPIEQVLDRVSDESCLRSALSRHIARDVHGADPADRMGLLQAALAQQAQVSAKRDSSIAHAAVRALVLNEGGIRIDELAAKFGVHRRSLERQFTEQVGIPPKSLANVLRFRRALGMVAAPSCHWAEICEDCGYYDQSHLIRDFKRYTGLTPQAYRAERGGLAKLRVQTPSAHS